MASLILKNVSKRFGDSIAVNDLSFTVNDGEFVVLVGPSGCGKSTILRLIAGLEQISQGEILIDGTVINNLAPKDRDIAMVFQNYALYPHMTVYKNLAFGLKMRGLPKTEIDSRVRKTAAALGLTPLLKRKPKALSGGQQQRTALGRAMVRQPKLFLFDEPLSNLDAKLRVSMRGELIKLHKKLSSTMIYVTHDQVEAMSLGDRLVVIQDGTIQQTGPPTEIYYKPKNLFVAGFIGSPSMNFMPCTIQKESSKPHLSVASTRLPLTKKIEHILNSHSDLKDKIFLGVRPENILEKQLATRLDSHAHIKVDVDFIEQMGNEIHATCHLGYLEIVARLNPRSSITTDHQADLFLDMESVHLFHPETGEALS